MAIKSLSGNLPGLQLTATMCTHTHAKSREEEVIVNETERWWWSWRETGLKKLDLSQPGEMWEMKRSIRKHTSAPNRYQKAERYKFSLSICHSFFFLTYLITFSLSTYYYLTLSTSSHHLSTVKEIPSLVFLSSYSELLIQLLLSSAIFCYVLQSPICLSPVMKLKEKLYWQNHIPAWPAPSGSRVGTRLNRIWSSGLMNGGDGAQWNEGRR